MIGIEGSCEQVVRVGVVECRQLQRDALVKGTTGQPIKLGTGHFQQCGAAARGELSDVAESVIAFGAFRDVRGSDRDLGLHRLQHSIAACHPFRP
jgi:hypothetical protein